MGCSKINYWRKHKNTCKIVNNSYLGVVSLSGTRLKYTKYSLRSVNCDDDSFLQRVGGESRLRLSMRLSMHVNEIIVSICMYIVVESIVFESFFYLLLFLFGRGWGGRGRYNEDRTEMKLEN